MRGPRWTLVLLVLWCHWRVTRVAAENVVFQKDDENSEEWKKDTERVLQQWKQIEKALKSYIGEIIKQLMPTVIEASSTVNISSVCQGSLLRTITGLRQLKIWAFRLVDATGKPMAGLLDGTLAAMGSYDECVDLVARDKKRNGEYGAPLFQGKYCTIEVKPPLPPKPKYIKLNEPLKELENITKGDTLSAAMARQAHHFYYLSMRFGLCIPSTCSKIDLENMMKSASQAVIPDFSLKVSRCELKEELTFNNEQIAVLAVLSVVAFIVFAGTTADILPRMLSICGVILVRGGKFTHSLGMKLLLSFSAYTNMKKLVNTKESKDSLPFLHGMKFLSLTWIVLGHTYYYTNLELWHRSAVVKKFVDQFAFVVVVNAGMAVDTFFFVSALLITYGLLRDMENTKKPFNIARYILHRIWRLSPAYFTVIGLMFLVPLISSGPAWHDTIDPIVDNCRNNWWSTLLYVSNYVNRTHPCLDHGWYLEAALQLDIFALVILIPLVRWPAVGLTINFLVMVGSVVITAVLTKVRDFPPTLMMALPDPEFNWEFSTLVFRQAYHHAASYSIGIFTGYILARKKRMKLSPVVTSMGWALAFACNMAVVYGIFDWNKGFLPSVEVAALYASMHRLAWAVGIAWVVYACFNGYGGVINKFLSWKAFLPLSRLSYVAYLVHPIGLWIFNGTLRTNATLSHYILMYIFFGHLSYALLASVAISLSVEAPTRALEKVIFEKSTSTSDSDLYQNNCAPSVAVPTKLSNGPNSGTEAEMQNEFNGRLTMSDKMKINEEEEEMKEVETPQDTPKEDDVISRL